MQNTETIYLRIFGDVGVTTNMEQWMPSNILLTKYKNPVILTNGENYTHAIILNLYMLNLKISKENVIGLSCEPNIFLFGNNLDLKNKFIEYAKNNISKYFVGDIEDLPEPFIEGQTYYVFNKHHFYNKPKYEFCSFIVSNKQDKLNYIYRHQLITAILNTNLPIDIYGSGTDYYKNLNDKRIKHPMEGTKEDFFGTIPYENYKFHICIENSISNNYFTEKIIQPLLSNNIPIYFGCRKINNYFNNVIKLTGNLENDINLLKYIYENQELYSNNNKQEDVMNTVNIFNRLHTLFSNILLMPINI